MNIRRENIMKRRDLSIKKGYGILKKAGTLAVVTALAAGLAGCGTSGTAEGNSAGSADKAAVSTDGGELTPVRVGIDAQQLSYVQIVAKEKGYFAENGIDVTLVNYAVGIDTINAIVLGEIDVGAAYDYAAVTRLAAKTNLRLTSEYVVNSEDTQWFETSDPDVKTAADLKGKRIALVKGTLGEYIWAKELEYGGLSEDDVELEYLSSGGEAATAYVSGQADAILGEINFKSSYETVEGRHTLNTTADIGLRGQGYIMADDTFAREHKDALVGYYKGLQEALDYISSNKDDAAQIAADYLTLSKDDILTSLNSYEYEIRFTQDDYDHIQDIADWCADNGITDQVTIKDYMNIDAVKEFVPDKVTYSEK